MNLTLQFLGAAGTVTGSRYLVTFRGKRLLIDCGMFQEWKFKNRNWDPLEPDPASIDAMLLTHAHLDHVGLLPRLAAQGFAGPVYATQASCQIARIIMEDAGRIQEEDAKYKTKRHQKAGIEKEYSIEPLYTEEEAKAAGALLQPVAFDEPQDVLPGISARFCTAGHILGAASIELTLTDGGEQRILLFSGDIGRWNATILEDPTTFKKADYLVVESTYGNRSHEPNEEIPEKLAGIINDTYKRGGNVIIPSFAVERSQDLLYHLSGLLHEKKIPPLMVFLDSPMAVNVTQVFRKNRDLFDAETQALIEAGRHPCEFPALALCRTVAQSKAINSMRGTAIVIAGSGMCTGGRIKHHLRSNIGRSDSTILFIGYQAEGTLGRQIVEGNQDIRLFGEMREVKAKIEKIGGFSGHADQGELLRWCSAFEQPPRHTFITHGEQRAAASFKGKLESELKFSCSTPEYQQLVHLT